MKKNIFTGFIILYTCLLSAQSNLNFEVKNLIYSQYPNTNIENTLLAINFWSVSDSKSRDLNKAFEKVANTYEFAHLKGGLKGIVVLLINKDNLSSLANISLSKDGIKKSINLKLSDLKQHNSDLPSNIIFDSNGKIIYNNLEAINVFEKINQLITR
jgi:hypothetical protein